MKKVLIRFLTHLFFIIKLKLWENNFSDFVTICNSLSSSQKHKQIGNIREHFRAYANTQLT